MEQLKEKVLNSWLEIEFYSTATKIGFIQADVTIPQELVYDTIRCLDLKLLLAKLHISTMLLLLLH